MAILEPYFLAKPSQIRLGRKDSYEPLGYYRYEGYTLISWRYGNLPYGEYVTGETLYRQRRLLAATGGTINLGANSRLRHSEMPVNPARNLSDLIFSGVGRMGVPQSVAINLRNPKNYRPIDLRLKSD